MSEGALTKQEAIDSFEVMSPEVLLIEMDKPPEQYQTKDGKISLLVKPESVRAKQTNTSESSRVLKMYVFDSDEEKQEAHQAHPKLRKVAIGTRIAHMDYTAPRGPFINFPELRVIGVDDVIGVLKTDKPIMN